MILWIAAALAGPADLAPGAPELIAAQRRLEALLATALATGEATSRLQAAWTRLPPPAKPCGSLDPDPTPAAPKPVAPKAAAAPPAPTEGESAPDPAVVRLEIGWRIERFGAAWREASQAVRAQAQRVRSYRSAATVAPLVDARWTADLDALLEAAERNERAFLEASGWEVVYVRPALAACPALTPTPQPGVPMLSVPVRGEGTPRTAVLALGDGWVCTPGATQGERADDAVILVPGQACWSGSPTCGCAVAPVEPGAILGRPE